MIIKDLDVTKANKFISNHVDWVTCLQCCRYYVAPETATCGHSLCHKCWIGRHSCPVCNKQVNRRSCTVNPQLKIFVEHIKDLVSCFESLVGVKMDEIDMKNESNPPSNVKEWLSSSQNHFSAPPFTETQKSTQDILPAIELSISKIQIHTESNRKMSPPKVVHVPPPQDDWDVIEQVPDTEDIIEKNKENVVGPMDLEPFYIDDNEYSMDNPRRSSRKKYVKEHSPKSINSPKKLNVSRRVSNNSSSETEKKLSSAKQNWTNVKRMRKEFSKLNKINKNKLNVSIEMCKKTQSVKSKQASQSPPINSPDHVYVIDEDTPKITENDEKTKQNKEKLRENENPKNDSVSIVKSTHENKENHNEVDWTSEKNKKDCDVSNRANSEGNKSPVNISKNIKRNNTDLVTNVIVNNVEQQSASKIAFVKKSNFQNTSASKPNVSAPDNSKISVDTTNLHCDTNGNDEDIDITIRIGSVVTNITISRKQNNVTLKVNSDQEIQACLGPDTLSNNKTNIKDNMNVVEVQNVATNTKKVVDNTEIPKKPDMKEPEKSLSTKKHTASADTATVQYEITESVEKELSNMMECDEVDPKEVEKKDIDINKTVIKLADKNVAETKNSETESTLKGTNVDITEEDLEDMDDIFNSGSVKENGVQLLKATKGTPSEILVSTHRTNKSKSNRKSEKRMREINEDEQLPEKRQRINSPENKKVSARNKIIYEEDTTLETSANYDAVLEQVFSSIDADIRESQKVQNNESETLVTRATSQKSNKNRGATQTITKPKDDVKNVIVDEKYSENMFSTIGNLEIPNVAGPETQKQLENLLTPGMCRDLGDTCDDECQIVEEIAATPARDDDSAESVVEETPQKNTSKQSSRSDSANKTVISNKKIQLKTTELKKPSLQLTKAKSTDSQDVSIINITNTVRESTDKDEIVPENSKAKLTLGTPLTIKSFVNRIQANSTPIARKSLNFAQNEGEADDNDVTLCPSEHVIAKTTQEKEIMSEAFQSTPVRKPLISKNTVLGVDKKFVIAGSCLNASELTNLKILCIKMKWTYVDKYTPDLTHLVVGVDDEKKAQRSVKYMCALAAGKWIIAYEWVKRCLDSNAHVSEVSYEALDSTGEPGPRRSRQANTKIFHGFTFYCMPPFSVLDLDTLKGMVEAAGGRVAAEASLVRADSERPALLLAEPQHTQEDKFLYMAMEFQIVPMNYEWVLNCLGGYELCPLHELLLCPVSLLPETTKLWPQELLVIDEE